MRASGLAEATPGVDRAARVIGVRAGPDILLVRLLEAVPPRQPGRGTGRTVQALTRHLIPFRLGVTLLGLLEIGWAIGLYLIPRYTWVLWLVVKNVVLLGAVVPDLAPPHARFKLRRR